MMQIMTVKRMTCEHGTKAVHDALTNLDGVQSVDVQLDTGKVEVAYDEAVVKLKELENAVEDQGYDVKK